MSLVYSREVSEAFVSVKVKVESKMSYNNKVVVTSEVIRVLMVRRPSAGHCRDIVWSTRPVWKLIEEHNRGPQNLSHWVVGQQQAVLCRVVLCRVVLCCVGQGCVV